jgi:hypothetical protein
MAFRLRAAPLPPDGGLVIVSAAADDCRSRDECAMNRLISRGAQAAAGELE